MFGRRSTTRRDPVAPPPQVAFRVPPVQAPAAASVPPSRRRTDPATLEEQLKRLDRAVDDTGAYLQEDVVSTGRLVNPMLVVWDAAFVIHPLVAVPAERLLIHLLHRTTVGVDEVRLPLAEVRARAMEVLVIEGGALTG